MSAPSWPIGSPAIIGPFTTTNFYIPIFLTTSAANQSYINLIGGGVASTAILDAVKNSSGQYETFITTVSQVPSFAFAALLALQNPAFGNLALPDTYANISVDWFNQFGIPSSIITTLLAYGNKDNLNYLSEADIIGIWPHRSSNAIIISIINTMTYMVKTGMASPAQIGEWRTIYANRPVCTPPSAKSLTNLLSPNRKVNTAIMFPQGSAMWDMLRYDFFSAEISGGAGLITLNPALALENDALTIQYDYLAAPGNILIRVKLPMLYNDGTGSTDSGGNNTSKVIINPSFISNTPYPTVFRIGLEFLPDFIDVMNISTLVTGDGQPLNINPLQAGTDLIPTLTVFSEAFLNCRRLYLWRLANDIMRYRVTPQYRTDPAASLTAITPNLGVYIAFLEGKTDYSSVPPDAITIPTPSWENLYAQQQTTPSTASGAAPVNDNLVVLTSVEIGAYISPIFAGDSSIPTDKFGVLRIFDNNGGPTITIPYSTAVIGNTIPAEQCFTDTKCWEVFAPPPIVNVTPPPPKGTSTGNIIFYVLAVIAVLVIIAVFLWYIIKRPKPKEQIAEVSPEASPPIPQPPLPTVTQESVTALKNPPPPLLSSSLPISQTDTPQYNIMSSALT